MRSKVMVCVHCVRHAHCAVVVIRGPVRQAVSQPCPDGLAGAQPLDMGGGHHPRVQGVHQPMRNDAATRLTWFTATTTRLSALVMPSGGRLSTSGSPG